MSNNKQTIFFQEIVDGVNTKQYQARIHVDDPIQDAFNQVKPDILADRQKVADQLAKKAAIDVRTFETFINQK